MLSQKHCIFSVALLAFCLCNIQAQLNNPYFIVGPEVLCAGQCDTFSVVSSQPGSGVPVTGVVWGISGVDYDNGNPGILCFDTPGLYNITASGFTANGQSVQVQPYSVTVEACNMDLRIVSNAPAICQANAISAPPLPPADSFALFLPDVAGAVAGQQVCMSITTQHFTNILGIQFSIHYDPARLQFLSVGNFGLPGLSAAGNFGLPAGGFPGMTAPGNISMYWQFEDGAGLSLPDGSVLFELCFTVLPGGGCYTDVVFANTPTAIEVINGNEQTIPFHSRPGRVRLSGNSTGGNPSAPGCCEKVCEGSTVQYRLANPATLPVSWQVRGAQSFTVNNNGQGVEVVWGTAGQGSVSVLMGDMTAQLCVDILALPEARFSASPAAPGDTLFLCRGQSISFSNTSVGGSSYLWIFGDGSSSDAFQAEYAYETAGTYRMALVANNECQCADTTFLIVLVAPALAPQVTCRGTVCEGTAVTYTTDADCGTFLWTISANGAVTSGGGPTDNFITIDWQSGPEGVIQLQVNNCANADYCPEPNIMRVPVMSSNTQINGPEQVCRAQSARYSITRFGGTEFNWSVSSLGVIQSGQGTHEVTVQWAGFLSAQPQWLAVQYNNCYLGCSGSDTIWVNIRPDFIAGGAVETCLGNPQSYNARRTDTGAGVPSNWEVLNGAGTVVWNTPMPAATTTIPWNFGSGYFRLVVKPAVPSDYCTPSYSMNVRVLTPPPALGHITGETNICTGLPYTYSAAGTLAGHSISWAVTGSAGAGTTLGNPINVTWSSSPPHGLFVRQISPQGCISAPSELSLSGLPAIAITGDAAACADDRATYAAPTFDGLNYAWSIVPSDAGTILQTPDTSTIQVLWHKAGPASVNLSLCGQNLFFSVTIFARPQPEVVHPARVCPGDSAQVQTVQAYASYSWKDEDGMEISTAAAPMLPAGYYRVDVVSMQGCAGSTHFRIETYPLPAVSASTPDNTGICPGDPPSTLYALNTASGYTFQWLRDGSPVAGANSATFSTAQLGNYQVLVEDTNGCMALSNVLVLFAYCDPGGGGGFPGGGSLPIPCPPNTQITFDILPAQDCNTSNFQNTSPSSLPGTLSWNFGDPGSGPANISNLENPSHTYSRAGFFRIVLVGTIPGPETCYAIGIDTVPVAPAFSFERACAGAAMPFTDASTFLPGETISSRVWNFGDPASGAGNVSTDENPSHVFSAPGVYTVTLTITAANGCSASTSRQVEVFDAPAVAFEIPSSICADAAMPFAADTGPDVVSVRWNFGDPASGPADSSTLFQPFHRYATPGSYTVSLEATNIFGCTGTFSRNIDIEPNGLGGAIAFSSPFCEGDSTLLTASPGGIRWKWSTGDTTETLWVREEGVYSVSVTDPRGCLYQPADVVVRVIPAPSTAIRSVRYNEAGLPKEYTYDSLSICAGEDVFLEVIARPGLTYQWSTGSTSTRIEFSENRGNVLALGIHEVFVTLTETASGCARIEGPFRIIVRPLPDVPLVTAVPAGNICEGTPVSFSIGNPQTGVTYTWSSGATGPQWETARHGRYNATATNEWGCTNTSAPRSILPGPNINLIPSGCHSRCRPDTLCFPPVPGVVSYQWFFNGTAQSPPSNTVPQVVVTQSGDYYMRMTTNQGCTLDSDPLTLDLFDGFGRIQGLVYWDRNDNDLLDPADSLLNNVPFILLSGNTPVDTVLSQSGGQYGFVNILSTSYGLLLDTAALPFGLIPDAIRIDTALVGCDVELLVNWRLRCITASQAITLEVCPGSDAVYNGVTLAIGSITDFTFTNAAGCDSIVTVSVVALPTSASSLVLSTCPGGTVSYNGTPITAGATATFTFVNAVGCDSVVTVTVNTLPTSASSLTLGACPGSTVNYNGASLAPGTTTNFEFVNAAGCDSLVTVTVNTLPTSAGTLSLSACPGSAVSYNGASLAPGTTTNFTFVNAAGCDSVVTVTVNALPAQTNTLALQACPGGVATYNGVDLPPGTIRDFVFANSSGCDSIVTVTVTAYPGMQIQTASQAGCPGRSSGSITASATGQGPFLYSLNGGVTTATGNFSGLAPGAYDLHVEDINGCETEVRVQVAALPPLLVDVPNTALPCDAESITLEPRLLSGDDGQVRFLWDDGATTPQRIITAPGNYRLTVANGCDTLVHTVQVRYAGRPDLRPVFVPNAFSPNDDGINDLFKAYASTEVTVLSFELMVFDRWGNLMFRTDNIAAGWNGVFRSRAMDPAVFVWHLRATVEHCGRIMALDEKGDVTLVR